MNGGTCDFSTDAEVGGLPKLICNCPPGYEGDKCELSEACHAGYCFNDGQCKVNGSQLFCDCGELYTGE